MKYRYSVPSPKVSRYISNFIFITSGNDDFDASAYFIPNGTPALVYHKADSFYLSRNSIQTLLPKLFFVGQLLQSQSVFPAGVVESILVIFKPAALFTMLQVNMKFLNTSLYLPADHPSLPDLSGLKQTLDACLHLDDCQGILENHFFKTHCQDTMYPSVERCIEAIQDAKGMVSITKLAGHLDIHPRTLRLHFEKMVGTSPKQYAKVVKMNKILDTLYSRHSVDWQEIIFDFGYFDQAHFIRDFRSITGTSPTAFIKKNLDHIKLTSGK